MKARISFALGALLGGVVTYVITKETIEKKAQAEINESREYFKKKYETPSNDIQEPKKFATDNKPELKQLKHMVNYAGYSAGSVKKDEKMEPNKIVNEIEAEKPVEEPDPDLEEDDYDEVIDESPKEGLRDHPYPISEESFSEEFLYHGKETLLLYENGVLATEDDQEVGDLDQTVGSDFLDYMGDDNGYFRNELVGIDYEVIRTSGDFRGDDD